MTNEEYMKHAYSVYQTAVAADGSVRERLLNQALKILANVPDGYPADVNGVYPAKDNLVSYIKSML